MTTETGGHLAAALAKAQGSFPKIDRSKTVTVTTKSGGSYTFAYAPLDRILEATRKPLTDNGLALVQMLDEGGLTTMLLHESGERLGGTIALPPAENIQGFGSAITYMRRYAIQAVLGIAAEEDDDGNSAVGNEAVEAARQKPADTGPDGLIGTAIRQGTQDFELRPGPDGPTLPFRLKNGTSSFICLAEGRLAEVVKSLEADVLDQRVTVWGHWTDESFPKGKQTVKFRVLHVERIKTADWTLPAPIAEGQVAAFDEDADLDAAAAKMPEPVA